MRPMSLAERGLDTPTVSLGQLLTGERGPIEGRASADLPAYIDEIVGSGFPGIRGLPPRARRAQLDGYIARIVERDFQDQGHNVRKPETLRAWLEAYAAATATTAAYNAILDAATPGESDKPAKTTTIAYRDVLMPAWAAGFSAYGCACADFEYRYDQTVDLPILPSADEIEDVFVMREALDGLAARLAAHRITPSELGRLRLILETMREAIANDRREQIVVANQRFHDVIYAAAGAWLETVRHARCRYSRLGVGSGARPRSRLAPPRSCASSTSTSSSRSSG
jgi:PAS domain-containing protein